MAAVNPATLNFTEAQMEFLKSVMFTPEKMAALVQELKKPFVDPAKEARELRERRQMKESYEAGRKNSLEMQARCRHQDAETYRTKIGLIQNFPDRLPRGVCAVCNLLIYPAHWDFRADGTPFKVDAHPLYGLVEDIWAKQGMAA